MLFLEVVRWQCRLGCELDTLLPLPLHDGTQPIELTCRSINAIIQFHTICFINKHYCYHNDDPSHAVSFLQGDLFLAVDGPDNIDISIIDARDNMRTASYLPKIPSEYCITVKYLGIEVPGSPFTAKIISFGECFSFWLDGLTELLVDVSLYQYHYIVG